MPRWGECGAHPGGEGERAFARSPAGLESELDHGADDLARLHRAEGVVHLLDLDAAADHPLEVELAVLPEAEEAREVDPDVGAAVHRALQVLLLEEELERAELHHLLHPAHADDHRRTAA